MNMDNPEVKYTIMMVGVLDYLEENDLLAEMDAYIPYETLMEVRKVLVYGDILYPDAPWIDKDADYHLAHAMDHIRSETTDCGGRDESGCHHVAHAIVRLMFYLAHKQEAV